MAANQNITLWGEGVIFVDGKELFEAQEVSLEIGAETISAPKGDAGGSITEIVNQPITGRVSFLGLNASILSALTGGTVSTGTIKRIRNEKLTKSTNTLTTSQTPIANTLRVVPAGANKQPLKQVASAPQVGEYSVSGTTITLNASQPESDFYVSYFYEDSGNGETVNLDPAQLPNEFELYASLRGKEQFSGAKMDVIVYAAKCQRTSGLSIGTTKGNFSAPGFDFSVRIDSPDDFKITFE